MIFKLILTLIVLGLIGMVILHHKYLVNNLEDQTIADKRLIKESLERINYSLDSTRVMEAYSSIQRALQTLYDLNSRYGTSEVIRLTGYDISQIIEDAEEKRDEIYTEMNKMYPNAVRKSQLQSYKKIQVVEDESSEDEDDYDDDEEELPHISDLD